MPAGGDVRSLNKAAIHNERLLYHYYSFAQYLNAARINFMEKYNMPSRPCGCVEEHNIITFLGTGTFGQVALVVHKTKKTIHAIKFVEKRHVLKTHQEQNLAEEIRLMKAFDFRFLLGLHYFFLDNVYVCIVMQFVNGGDMFTHLRKNNLFPEEQAKFYAAQILLAFEYLHQLGVIHRDLKPENVLLDIQGYLKLTDFGFSKKIDNHRTYTLCGTPEYIAPEIILHQGYSNSVDYWALGILIFEMNAGHPPFFAQDHIKLYEKIVSGKFYCPANFSRALKDLMKNMLEVDRSKRYGNLKRGVKDIKGHEWFADIDYDQVYSRQIPATYIPDLDDELDTRYFHPKESLRIRRSTKNECEDTFKNLF